MFVLFWYRLYSVQTKETTRHIHSPTDADSYPYDSYVIVAKRYENNFNHKITNL